MPEDTNNNNNFNNNGQTNTKCLKFSLMVCNSFGIVIGIFVVLFGLAYSSVTFPGGYDGNNTAMFAGFFIMFSFIGYCGAHRLSHWLLLIYALIILGFTLTYFVKWLLKSDVTCLDSKAYAIIFFSGLFLVMMMFAFALSHKLKKTREAARLATRSLLQKSNTPSTSSSFISIPKFGQRK